MFVECSVPTSFYFFWGLVWAFFFFHRQMLSYRVLRSSILNAEPQGLNMQDFKVQWHRLMHPAHLRKTESEIIEIYKFFAQNTIWVKNATMANLREVIWHKIRCFSYRTGLYQKLLQVFPIRLCRYCLHFTSNEHTLCSKHIHITWMLQYGWNLPRDLMDSVFLFVGVPRHSTYDYQIQFIPHQVRS